MKQILKFSILLLFFMPLQKVVGQAIIMGSQPLVTNIGETVRTFYDPGGPDAPFGTSLRDTMTLQVETQTKVFYVWFQEFTMGNRDTLWIFNGPDVNAPLQGAYTLVESPGEFHSTSNTLTFVFHSDSVHVDGMDAGWKAHVYQYDDNAPVVLCNGDEPTLITCNADFYDAGGPNGNIGYDPADHTFTQRFTSATGAHIMCEFESFSANGLLKIYDGQLNTPTVRLIGQFCTNTMDNRDNNGKPPTLFSISKTMTFVYEGAPGDASKSGWKAHISCATELFEADTTPRPCPEVINSFSDTHYSNSSVDSIMHPDSAFALGIVNFLNNGTAIPWTEDSENMSMRVIDLDFEHQLVMLKATPVKVPGSFSNDYTVKQIPYNENDMMFGYDAGNTIVWQQGPARDDSWLGGVDLPFTFTFFGVPYTRVYPSSNGLVSFDAPPEGEWQHCDWSTSVPPASPTLNGSTYSYASTPYNYYNSAFLVYEDINPASGCTPNGATAIRYGVLGEYPCRAFVFNYNGINLYSCCASTGPNTYQMVMYEGTNVIDVYIKRRNICTSWNGGRGVIGLQNRKGSQRVIAPGRDFTSNWTVNVNSSPNVGEAWRFTPVTSKPENKYGYLCWFKDTVDFMPAKGIPKVDTLGPHCIAYSSTAKDSILPVYPQDTTLYISVYQYEDAQGGLITLYGITKVNVTIPKIKVESDKKTYCPEDTIHLEVTDVLDPAVTLSDIIRCKWWSKKHPSLWTSDSIKNDVSASYITPGTPDTIYVTVTFNNKAQRTDSVIVFVTNPIRPTITSRNFVTKEDYICKGDTLTLLATHPKTDQFEWNTGETSRFIEVHPLNDALYIVTTKNDCQVSDTFKVVVLPLPPTFFTPDPVDIIMDNGIGTVTCTTPLSQGGYQLTWNFDDPNSPDNIVQGPDVVTHGYTRPRDYTITLTAVDANNCDSTYTDRVSVKVPDLFYVPSAFSPNNDKDNQYFYPSGQIVDPDRPYSMEIFNRYGMLVFSTNSPYDYWDGRNKKGELCPEGVYVYMISFYHINEHDNPDALPAVRKGTVTLLR